MELLKGDMPATSQTARASSILAPASIAYISGNGLYSIVHKLSRKAGKNINLRNRGNDDQEKE